MTGILVLKDDSVSTKTVAAWTDPRAVLIDGPVRLVREPAIGRAQVVFPAGVRLEFTNRGSIDLNGISLRLESAIVAGDHRIFVNATSGPSVSFSATSGQGRVQAAWWGASVDASPAENRAAIAAAFASMPTGGTVALGAGEYHFDSTIVLPDGCSLVGMGRDATRLSWPSTTGIQPRVCIVCTGNCRCEDLGVSGGVSMQWTGADPGCCVQVRGGEGASFRNVRLDGNDIGLATQSADRLDIERCEFAGQVTGILLDASADVRIRNCVFNIDLGNASGVALGRGRTAAQPCVNTVIEGSTFTRAGTATGTRGVRVLNGRLVQIRDCRFERLAAGVTFATDSVDGIGADVGRCRFVHCGAAVDPGNVSARVRVQGRGGSATLAFMQATPPDEASWQRGDRIDNSEPKPGEPVGWVCSGTDPTTGRKRWWSWARVGPSAPAKT